MNGKAFSIMVDRSRVRMEEVGGEGEAADLLVADMPGVLLLRDTVVSVANSKNAGVHLLHGKAPLLAVFLSCTIEGPISEIGRELPAGSCVLFHRTLLRGIASPVLRSGRSVAFVQCTFDGFAACHHD